MAADLVLLSEQEGIATVTVNRPEKLNALNEDVIARLAKVFEECRDLASTRAVILTGAGDRAFIAGAD
ncbi:MAG: enoyl-CoA hydratase/isomerase family protein, partial [Planctomycetes bacterium]|nr:enoyl-CoA hydratase/isomerase family protein [Planctomycetota bacterium]